MPFDEPAGKSDEDLTQEYINSQISDDDVAGLQWLLDEARKTGDEMAPVCITQEGAEKLIRQLPRLMAAADALEAAERVIKERKCFRCAGKGKFWPAPWNLSVPLEICNICNGDGLHPQARDWLARHATGQRKGGDDDNG